MRGSEASVPGIEASPVSSRPRVRALAGGAPGGALALVTGIVLVFIGTMAMDDVTAWPRWLIAAAGLFLLWRGIDMLCRSAFGDDFPTGLWAAGIWVVLLILLAVFAPLLPFESPRALPLDSTSFVRPALFSAHPLGTDNFGRDYLSRVVYGARVSLLVGLVCTAIGLTIGTAIGICAGYFRRRTEAAVNLFTDAMLAFPPFVFLLALVAVLRPGIGTTLIAFSLLAVPTIVRLARANTYVYAQREFVVAAKALGTSDRRIILHEILPNVLRPLVSYAMIMIALFIVAEAALSFLGLGIKAPYPSWGNMIAENQTVIDQYPHALLVPAAALFITVLAFNRLGDAVGGRHESAQVTL